MYPSILSDQNLCILKIPQSMERSVTDTFRRWRTPQRQRLKLEENKAAVIARVENNFKMIFYEALEILSQSNRYGRFELPALYRDVLARDFVHSSPHDKYFPASFTWQRRWGNVESLWSLKHCLYFGILCLIMSTIESKKKIKALLDALLLLFTFFETAFTLLARGKTFPLKVFHTWNLFNMKIIYLC